jgi:hypothetical protein
VARKLGSYRPVPEWGKAQVIDYLDAERGRRVRLAKKLKCSPGTITDMLKPAAAGDESTSRLARDVARETGIPLGDEVAFAELGELLSEAQRVLPENASAVKNAIALLRAVRHAEERARTRAGNQPVPPRDNRRREGDEQGDR